MAGQPDQSQRNAEGRDAGQPVFRFDHARQAERRQPDNPEAFAFQRKLRIDEARGQGGEIERAGPEVQIRDQMHPERVGELLGKMAQVDDVSAEQSKQHERLAPLGRVAPEDADVLYQQRANVRRHGAQEANDTFDRALGVIEVSLPFLPGAEPGPLPEHAAAALHGGRGFVEQAAHPRERQTAEEERVTQEDQRKKPRSAQGSFGPAQHTRGKPIAGQKRELREPRFHQQTVEHRQHSRFEHLVGDRLGPQPERRADEHQQRQRHRSHLKRPPIQVTGDVDRQPRARNGRQDDEKRHQHHRGQVKMPRDTVAEAVSGEQRRD